MNFITKCTALALTCCLGIAANTQACSPYGDFQFFRDIQFDAVVKKALGDLPLETFNQKVMTHYAKSSNIPNIISTLKANEKEIANVRLAVALQLNRQRLVDEALQLLDGVNANDVVDPVSYHFVMGSCYFQLEKFRLAKSSLDELAKQNDVPSRYETMASLMRLEMGRVQKKELAGIAHLMRDAHRRIDLGQTDNKTQDVEEQIIARLDAIIGDMDEEEKDKEKKECEQCKKKECKACKKQGITGHDCGTKPAPDSTAANGQGSGQVAKRNLQDGDQWGNLTQKERDAVRAEIAKEFPAHYRRALEQYYPRLAQARAN